MAEQQAFNFNISGGSRVSDGVQAGGIAGRDIIQANQGSTIQSNTNATDVVELIGQLQGMLQQSNLSPTDREKAMKHLDTVKEEVETDEPDKEYALKSFQRATKVIQDAGETVEATSSLWQQLEGIAEQIAPWFGVAAKALLLL